MRSNIPAVKANRFAILGTEACHTLLTLPMEYEFLWLWADATCHASLPSICYPILNDLEYLQSWQEINSHNVATTHQHTVLRLHFYIHVSFTCVSLTSWGACSLVSSLGIYEPRDAWCKHHHIIVGRNCHHLSVLRLQGGGVYPISYPLRNWKWCLVCCIKVIIQNMHVHVTYMVKA